MKHLFRTIILTEVHAACFEESHLIWAIAVEQCKRRPVCHNHGGDKASHKKATKCKIVVIEGNVLGFVGVFLVGGSAGSIP